MPRTPYKMRNPLPGSGVRGRYVRMGMDVNFIVRNWKAINETPIKKAGLLVRKIMRGSIRRQPLLGKTGKARKASKPGRPPYARTGVGSRLGGGASVTGKPPFKRIYSIPYADNTKAVIGHERLPIKKQDPRITPMRAHEFGETVQREVRRKRHGKAKTEKQRRSARKKYLEGKIKQKGKSQRVTRKIRMPKRPFAKPALMKGKSKMITFWKGALSRGRVKKG